MNAHVIQRHSQLAHHGHQGALGTVGIVGLLGLVPRTHPTPLHQAQHRKIEPLSCPRAAPLADPQVPLVRTAAVLHQVQPHRFAVGTGGMILPGIAGAGPQDTRRRHAHHLPLGLQDGMSGSQTPQLPLCAVGLLPCGQSLLA